MASLFQFGALRLMPTHLYSQPSRTTTSKHYDPKFKKLRKLKYMKVELPNMNEDFESMTPEKVRQKMKERGLMPARPWVERQYYISATGKHYPQFSILLIIHYLFI